MKHFAIIKNDRVLNTIVSPTPLPDVTSVEITAGQVSKGYGYTGSVFYEPINYQVGSEDLNISGSDTISLLLNRSLSSTLDSSSYNCTNYIEISNFVHDNVANTIIFTATTASHSNINDCGVFEFNDSLTDTLGFKWDLNPFNITVIENKPT
tara:strand:+ start:736 stop:1191 length:456 start_codon:yes stop_codon:yes gene_type:complete